MTMRKVQEVEVNDVEKELESDVEAIESARWDFESSIAKFKFRIEGCAPGMLFNNPLGSDHFRSESESGSTQGVAPTTPRTGREEAAGMIYKMADGKLCVPAIWFRNAIMACSKGKKMVIPTNKGKKTVAANPVIKTSVMVPENDKFLITRNGVALTEKDWIPHSMRAVINKKFGILRTRPLIVPPFQIEGELDYFSDAVPISVLEDFLRYAGKFNGLGDFRPEKGGWFGRFLVAWTNAPERKKKNPVNGENDGGRAKQRAGVDRIGQELTV
jgi:hypothetical protein